VAERIETQDVPYHGRRYSIEVALAPLSVLVLVPERAVPPSLRA
jgi:hypothetical protein